MNDLVQYSIADLAGLYRAHETTVRDVVRAYLDAIAEREPRTKAYLQVFAEGALDEAAKLDAKGYDGRALYGVPMAVKDNICTRGLPTTCASRILEGYRPPYDATVVERLKAAGAVIIGKTNMDEFAMGSSTENSAFQVTRNPWNEEFVPGGSSGGSAAAVAAGMTLAALGSDTGGSVRQPASLCGVVGLKGTYGRVSRYGLVAFASSLDQIGPLARDVRDCAAVMEVVAGRDERDATTIPGPAPDLRSGLEKGLEGLRIAAPRDLETWEIDDSVKEAALGTIRDLENAHVKVDRVDLPSVDISIASYYVLANAEASSNLARYDGVKYGLRASSESLARMYEETRGEGFGDEVKRRILLGTYVLSAGYYDAYYAKAQKVRALICSGFNRLFESCDLLLLPTSPTPAFRLGEKLDDPITMYLTDVFTTQANIAGLPAISVPAGLSPGALPIGMQLVAAWGEEAKLMRGAFGLERIYRFRERFSPGSGKGKGRHAQL
ncbi:MAG TPA: Asp-tRNA(Asn)/Glu-tRNA(Gln) amidotransferase subunit GatA [Candidatus Krumholzibacteriaceae bacterium]